MCGLVVLSGAQDVTFAGGHFILAQRAFSAFSLRAAHIFRMALLLLARCRGCAGIVPFAAASVLLLVEALRRCGGLHCCAAAVLLNQRGSGFGLRGRRVPVTGALGAAHSA